VPGEDLALGPRWLYPAKAARTLIRSAGWAARTRGRADVSGIRILFYHRVAPGSDELAVSPQRFAAQMAELADRGYRVLDVPGVARALDEGADPASHIGLSFDDGYADVAEHALPVLEQYGFDATVFISTGVTDGRARFSWYRREQPPLLGWETIRALDGGRLGFEPHTVTHPNLLHLDAERARREIEESKRELEERLERATTAFCYPAGLFGRRERDLVEAVGLTIAVSCEPGPNVGTTDRLALHRSQIDRRDTLLDFRAKVGGGHDRPPRLRAVYRRARHGTSDDRAAAPPDLPPEAAAAAPGMARASALVLIGKVGANLGYFAAVLVLARALGPSARGAVAFFTTVALIVGVVSAGGLREAATVYIARDPDRRAALAATTLVFGLALAIVSAVIVCGFLVAAPGAPAGLTDGQIVLLGGGILAAGLLNLGSAIGLGMSLFRQQALLQPFYVWAYAAMLAVVWSVRGLSVTSAAVIWTLGQLLGGVLMTVSALRRTGVAIPKAGLVRDVWGFGVRAWIGSLSTLLNFRTDQVIMGAISTNAALGVYAVAVNASEVELYVPQAVSNSLLPIIASTPAEERVERAVRTFRLVTILTLAGSAVALALGPFLLPLVFGDAFRPSVGPFLWLVLGGIGFVASSIFSAAFAASSAPGLSSVGPFVSLVVGIVLDFALIPEYGATGAAIAATSAFFAGGVVAAVVFVRSYDLAWTALVPRREDASGLAAVMLRRRRA
jgi:O-antigen/teichoic acid export membrane protein/peptidoglycan/xylan/chitin deacetylase (PgdA/CDA1 family)